jgi:hypothetical protein
MATRTLPSVRAGWGEFSVVIAAERIPTSDRAPATARPAPTLAR